MKKLKSIIRPFKDEYLYFDTSESYNFEKPN